MIVDGVVDLAISGAAGAVVVVDMHVLELWCNHCTEIIIITC